MFRVFRGPTLRRRPSSTLRRPPSAVRPRPLPRSDRHQLDFSQPLRGPHDTRGIDRFVGGDKHKRLHPLRGGHPREQPRPEHIVADGLRRLPLHQIDVFVRGRMEDDVRSVARKDKLHPLAIQHVTNQGQGDRSEAQIIELLLDVKQTAFRLLHHQESAGIECRDLPAQFAADTATRPRH